MYVNFEIEGIDAGWFDVTLRGDDFIIGLTASDGWENDSPKKLLEILCDLVTNDNIHRYVIWDEEPGVYIICISKVNQKYTLALAYSKKDHDNLPEEMSEGIGALSYHEMPGKLGELEELLYVRNLNFNYFTKTVVRSFQEYKKKKRRDRYEGNWMDFPHAELEKLEQLLMDDTVSDC